MIRQKEEGGQKLTRGTAGILCRLERDIKVSEVDAVCQGFNPIVLAPLQK